MPTDDVTDQMLRDADPLRDFVLPDAEEPAARGVLAAAKKHRGRNPRRVAVVAVAAVVAVGAGFGVVSRRDGHPGTSVSVDCESSAVSDGGVNLDIRTDDPVRVCAQRWQDYFSEPVPAQLTACVDASEQGSIKVYPGGPDVCEAHGAVRYIGPTDEQRRFADFLQEGEALRDDAGGKCISPDQLRTAVRQLLAKHHLAGWTFGRPNGREPECAAVVGFNEPKRLIITNQSRR